MQDPLQGISIRRRANSLVSIARARGIPFGGFEIAVNIAPRHQRDLVEAGDVDVFHRAGGAEGFGTGDADDSGAVGIAGGHVEVGEPGVGGREQQGVGADGEGCGRTDFSQFARHFL
jgi:hypothetical protein